VAAKRRAQRDAATLTALKKLGRLGNRLVRGDQGQLSQSIEARKSDRSA